MRMHHPSQEQFDKDIANHQMIVIQDTGLHRHLRFKAPGTINQYFDIITWKGHLCYTGDMGTFVFSRIEDMFNFFRAGQDSVRINPGYWAEKLLAADRGEGHSEFDREAWEQQVRDELAQYVWENIRSRTEARELIEYVKEQILDHHPENEYVAMDMVFSFHDPDHPDVFADFWEHSFRRPTYRYIWCCRALVWAIERYDQSKQVAA